MILKTTLNYSNPAIIRQFYIKNDATVGDLLMSIAIVHGWDASAPLHLYDGKSELDVSMNLGDEFRESVSKDAVTVSMKMDQSLYYYGRGSGNQVSEWNFRVELLEEEEEYDAPCLIRFRGLNPYIKCPTMNFWNELCEYLMEGKRYYYMNDVTLEQLRVKEDSINRQLQRKLVLKQEEVVLNEKCGGDLQQILEANRLDDLKFMIRENDLPINYNQRKIQVIDELAKMYDRDEFWNRVLEEMDLNEYETFKKMCFAKSFWANRNLNTASMHILHRYRLLVKDRNNQPVIPEGLLQYYGHFLENSGEEELIYKKKIRNVLEVANRLYGVYTKPMCKQLAVVMYPKEVKPADISKLWRNEGNRRLYNAFVMYNSDELYSDAVFDLTKETAFGVSGSYYVPSQKEAMSILENGLNFSQSDQNELRSILKKFSFMYYYDQDAQGNLYVKEIYHFCHINAPQSEIQKVLFDLFELKGSRQNVSKLMKTIEKLRSKVRTIKNYGFTDEEMKIRNLFS